MKRAYFHTGRPFSHNAPRCSRRVAKHLSSPLARFAKILVPLTSMGFERGSVGCIDRLLGRLSILRRRNDAIFNFAGLSNSRSYEDVEACN